MQQQCGNRANIQISLLPQSWMLIFRPEAPSVPSATAEEGEEAELRFERIGSLIF